MVTFSSGTGDGRRRQQRTLHAAVTGPCIYNHLMNSHPKRPSLWPVAAEPQARIVAVEAGSIMAVVVQDHPTKAILRYFSASDCIIKIQIF